MALVLAIVIVAVVAVGAFTISQRGGFSFSINTNGGGSGDGDNTPNTNTGTTSVYRSLAISLGNRFSSDMAEMQLDIYVNGAQQKYETVYTDSSGQVTTNKKFSSGDMLDIYFVNSTSKGWINNIEVPYMSAADASGGASDPNPLDLKEAFTIGTYTTDTLKVGATAINDAGSYNSTLTGNTPVFKYTIDNTGADNTGLVDSTSPLTNGAQNWGTWVVIKFSGTGAQDILVSGGDVAYNWNSGSDQYACIQYDSNRLTKWIDGASTSYVSGYEGTDTHGFSLDLSGYSGTAVTMQITAYAYCDPGYAQDHANNFGSAKVQIAEQTVTLTV